MTNSSQSTATTVVVTVLNEEKTVAALLSALSSQTLTPKEVIMVDGGSTDSTLSSLQSLQKTTKKFRLRVLKQKGNRSVGRNTAIAAAKTNWIAITDAGCVPELDWLMQLHQTQHRSQAPVIAGYYRAEPATPFEEAVVPYTLVMPDRVNEFSFLPATRSMLLKRSIWKQLGGFDEALPDNEDFAFAKQLQRTNTEIAFSRNAVVLWQPRSSLGAFIHMIFRFARGDAQAGIIRAKVLLIFFRYLVAGWIFLAAIGSSNMVLLITLVLGGCTYILWAIQKNYQYVTTGWYWLPVLQVTSDLAVLAGSFAGIFRGLKNI